MRPTLRATPLLLLLILAPAIARAGGGPFGIDYELGRGDTSIFNRGAQTGLEYGSVAFIAAGALILGNDSQLGHTFWQSADSAVFAGLSAQVLKHAFRRARPIQGDRKIPLLVEVLPGGVSVGFYKSF